MPISALRPLFASGVRYQLVPLVWRYLEFTDIVVFDPALLVEIIRCRPQCHHRHEQAGNRHDDGIGQGHDDHASVGQPHQRRQRRGQQEQEGGLAIRSGNRGILVPVLMATASKSNVSRSISPFSSAWPTSST